MGFVTVDAIKVKLSKYIREHWRNLPWNGIDMDMVHDLDEVSAIINDRFRYEGQGEYEFSADISFMVKEVNNPFGTHRKLYRIFPFCKMSIEESDNDFKIEITSSIILQRRQGNI